MVVLIDAQRADHLGCYGYPEATSPEIDRLARRGLLFERCFTTAPWTYSSTASLVTGLYPAAHGAFTPGEVRNHTTNPYPPALSPSIDTIGEVLATAGWRTALFSTNAYVGFGIQQGFETYVLEQNTAPEQVDLALNWLRSAVPLEERFFTIIHFIDVHEPNRPPAIFRKMFEGSRNVISAELKLYGNSRGDYGTKAPESRPGYETYRKKRIGVYDAAIRYTDRAIGRLAREVRAQRPDEEIVFIITADHGEEFWDHGTLQSAHYEDPRGIYGLAHGHSFFDELMRVPLVFEGGSSPPARVSPSIVSLVDVMPTMLDYFGMPHWRPPVDFDGISLGPEFARRKIAPRTVLLDALVYGRDRRATADTRYKLMDSDVESTLLFDLLEDPAERHDVAGARATDVATAGAVLDSLYARSLLKGRELRKGDDLEDAVEPDAAQIEVLRALGYVE